MSKLPVFRTFGNAVGFTIWNGFTIFRLTWLPFATLGVLGVAMDFFMGDFERAGLDGVTFLAVGAPALILLQIVATSAAAVAIHRVILFGDRSPDVYFKFAFGKIEFFFIVMAAISALIGLAILSAILAPVAFAIASGDFMTYIERLRDAKNPMSEIVQSGAIAPLALAYLLGWIVVCYFFLRLVIWPPSIVATGRLSPAESWRLTRGNVWRFVGLFAIPYLLVAVSLLSATSYYYMKNRHPDGATVVTTATVIASDPAAATPNPFDRFGKVSQRQIQLHLAILEFFLNIYGTAFAVGLISFSYKALKNVPSFEPIAHEG